MTNTESRKKFFQMAYGLGASVVIIGALFKILHFKIWFLTGGVMLTIGMVSEAIVFAISAFEPVDEDLDWTKVYPELNGGGSTSNRNIGNTLSEKLDGILRDANIDAELMLKLKDSIQNFKGAADNIAPAVNSIAATNKYSEQLSLASSQMESLNNMYKLQLENATSQVEMNRSVVENAAKLKDQMESLATNMEALNNVYGGMLTAMSKTN